MRESICEESVRMIEKGTRDEVCVRVRGECL